MGGANNARPISQSPAVKLKGDNPIEILGVAILTSNDRTPGVADTRPG